MVYFISEQYLKEFTPISANVDPKSIITSVPAVQDMYIQDLLGSNFYNYLWAKYVAQTLNSDEEVLVEKIKPALAYRAAEQVVPFLATLITNKGPQYQNSDNSTNADLNGMRYLRKELQNKAEFYEERVVRYLTKNASLFPEYTIDNATDMKPDKSDQYNFGFAFPKYNDCWKNRLYRDN